MKNFFSKKKYTIGFTKSYQHINYEKWRVVTDAYILCILSELQKKYNFVIITIELNDNSRESKIVIKCNKEDKDKIFIDFCTRLSAEIEKVSMR